MGTSLSTGCTWDGTFVSFRCLKSFLEPSLDLAVDILRRPSFPEPEWGRLQGQTLAAVQWAREIRPTAFYGTPSYALHFAETARRESAYMREFQLS